MGTDRSSNIMVEVTWREQKLLSSTKRMDFSETFNFVSKIKYETFGESLNIGVMTGVKIYRV